MDILLNSMVIIYNTEMICDLSILILTNHVHYYYLKILRVDSWHHVQLEK